MTAAEKFDHIMLVVSLCSLGAVVLIALYFRFFYKPNHSTDKKSR